ncbi:MAG: hypothetical protein PHY34_06400 [Patescibacteria group bacterium]|nr:hypothetical protein [Patescibacteria group bacterium]MDD5716074.1 hypothetical protein [Patescibacteria group bacterium]
MLDASTIWLKTSYFFLSHRNDLRKWWVIVLIAIVVFLVVFAFTNGILYLINTPHYSSLIGSMASSPLDYTSIRQQNMPQALEFGTISVVSVSQGRYDLIAPVRNPNAQWAAASVEYRFSIQGYDLESDVDFVLPEGQKFFVATNVELGQTPSAQDARVAILGCDWEHIDNTDPLAQELFLVNNISFSTSSVGNYGVYRVTADVTNDSFLNFWEARFAVVFFNGDQVVGVEYATVEPFNAGETQAIMVQHGIGADDVTSVAVTPDVNILDTTNTFVP